MSRRLGAILCVVIGVLFFVDALLLDRTVIPTGPLYTEQPWKNENPQLAGDPAQQYDLIQQFYPWAHYFKRSVQEGRLPLWNPYNYLGTPFFANPQTALLFPLTWLHLFLPLQYSFTLIFLCKLTICLLGMYYWLCSLRLKPEACLIGSLIFSLSMNTASSLAFPYSNVTVLFPWALFFLRRLLSNPTRRNLSWLAIVLVLIVFAGQPQAALPAFLALVCYALLSASLWRIGLVMAAFLVAGLVASIQWIPSLAYVAESMVPLGPRIIKSTYPFDVSSLLTFLVPDFFGGLLRGDYWGFPGYHYTAFYSSVVAILLVPFAFRIRGQRIHPGLSFPVGIGLLALGIILGLPVFEHLLELPGFDLLRRHRFSFLLIFCVAELGARGADHLFRGNWGEKVKTRILVVTSLLGVLGLCLGFWRFSEFLGQLDPHGFTIWSGLRSTTLLMIGAVVGARPAVRRTSRILVLLVLLDLAWLSYGLNPRGSAPSLYPPSNVATRLMGDKEKPRIFSFHSVFNPNTAMVYGLQDVRGYDVITPRRLFRFMQHIDPELGNLFVWFDQFDKAGIHRGTLMREAVNEALERHGDELKQYFESESYWTVGISKVENRALFDLLQIDYVLGPPARGLTGFDTVFPDEAVRVQANPTAQRAKLYTEWQATTEAQALESLKELDPQNCVVVETSLPSPALRDLPVQLSLRNTTRESQHSRYQIDSDRPSVLVEFERFSTGWRAFLDQERELEVFPAQSIFRAVYVPAGKHEIEFRYDPGSFKLGLLLSGTGLIIFLLLLLVNLPERMKRRLQV